jgi:glycosyltransferase involved in cell wall biosynthesis
VPAIVAAAVAANPLEVRGFPSPIPVRKAATAAAAAAPAPKAEPKPQKVELLTVTQLPAAEIPDVTVVIPLITAIDFLEDALLSVKRQTYAKWTGIIGTVGQTEANQNKIKALINNSGLNNRFAVVDLAQGTGLPGALTRISSDAKTRFVAVLEASDIWLPKKLELQVKQATTDGLGIVGSLYREFGESNKPVNLPVGKLYRTDLEKGNPLILSSVLIASDIAVFTDEFASFDYDCWVRNHLKGVPIANLDSIQVLHRITRTTMFNPVDKQPEQIRDKYFAAEDDGAYA